jgi:hypothetical protein
MQIVINEEACKILGRIMRDKIKPSFTFDRFDDPFFFPPPGKDKQTVADYFFFMTAIDHRTHYPGRRFQSVINRRIVDGSDLLYGLARRKALETPEYFTAERLQYISTTEVNDLFTTTKISKYGRPVESHMLRNTIKDTPHSVTVRNPRGRAKLLKDCARKLLQLYNGKAINIVRQSDGYLLKDDGSGFLQLLGYFDAYSDPLRKKAYLLTKVYERREILEIKDVENLNVPVDNLLMRIALRCGLIEVINADLVTKLRAYSKVSKEEEFEIRETTKRAYRIVSETSDLRATFLDDILWKHGKDYCRRRLPACVKRNGCPFGEGCRATYDPIYASFLEPNFPSLYY